jgi:hypothetical protein
MSIPNCSPLSASQRRLEELVVESEEAMIMESWGKDEAWRRLQGEQAERMTGRAVDGEESGPPMRLFGQFLHTLGSV